MTRTSLIGTALAALLALGLANTVGQFLRAATAVVAPDIMREFAIGPETMGIVTGLYFASYALIQLPAGMLFDRFGVRASLSAALVAGVGGALICAAAPTVALFAVGRLLLGVGIGGVLIGAFVVIARWYPKERFGRIASRFAAATGVGTILATTPLAVAVAWTGWRGAFTGIAVATAVSALLIWLFVRDAPPGHDYHARRPERLGEVLAGLREVFGYADMRRAFAMSLVALGTQLTVTGLWAGPYLTEVHGLDRIATGNVLLAMAIMVLVGTLLFGSLEAVIDSRKAIVCVGAGGTILLLLALGLWPSPGVATVTVLLAVFGLFGNYGISVSTYNRSLYPDRLVGRGIAAVNFGMVGGIALLQSATGFVIGRFVADAAGRYPETAYKAVFLFLAAVTALALLLFSGARDIKVRAAVPAAGPGKKTDA